MRGDGCFRLGIERRAPGEVAFEVVVRGFFGFQISIRSSSEVGREVFSARVDLPGRTAADERKTQAMRINEAGPLPADAIAEHVQLPTDQRTDRAFVRLNMIASADGGSAVAGRSGKLGNRDDHAVFAALRAQADIVLVGMSTAVSEQYHPAGPDDAAIYVVASTPDVGGVPELFTAGGATLVIPEDVGAAPADVLTLRAGVGGRVDLAQVVDNLVGRVVMMEGGPRLAGVMVALGLVDEFFLTLAPRLVGGDSTRVVHGLDADPTPWMLRHCLVDDDGFVFLRYAKPVGAFTSDR